MDIYLFKKELQRPLSAVQTKLGTVSNKLMEDDLQEAYLLSLAIKKELEKEYYTKLLHLLKQEMINIINRMYEIPELNDEQGKRLESMEKKIPLLVFDNFNEAFVLANKIMEELNEQK